MAVRLEATDLDKDRCPRCGELIGEPPTDWRAEARDATALLNAALAREGKLRAALREAITACEDGEEHDEGAFDPECPRCLILNEWRKLLDADLPTADDVRGILAPHALAINVGVEK